MGCCVTKEAGWTTADAGNSISTLAYIQSQLDQWTGRKEEGHVIRALEASTPDTLNYVLHHVDINHMFDDVDDRWVGPDNRTALRGLLTETRRGDLDIKSRIRLVIALQRRGDPPSKSLIRSVDRSQLNDLDLEEAQITAFLAALRRCRAEDLPPEVVKELTRPSSTLAQADVVQLPHSIRQGGERAITLLAQAVLARFPAGGKGVSLTGGDFDSLLSLMGLTEIKPQLPRPFEDVASFVLEVARLMRLNPVLLAFGAEWLGLSDQDRESTFPPLTPERDAEIRLAVSYCYLQHVVGHALMYEPKRGVTAGPDQPEMLWETVRRLFEKKRDEVNWKDHFNAFERMKVVSIDLPVKSFVEHKTSAGYEYEETSSSGALLSINILEAMYQDVLQGYEENAEAGYELMMEPADRDPIKGTGSDVNREWVFEGEKSLGVVVYKPPFPTAWSHIYQAWNLAFVSTYPDNLLFYGKLLAPVVSGTYLDHEGLYLYPRVVCLWLHVHYTMFSRAEAQSRTPPFGDWRSEVATSLFGRVNREAGRQFQQRVEKAVDDNYSVGKEVAYDLKRMGVRPQWLALKGMIVAARELGEGSEKVPEFFEGLMSSTFEHQGKEKGKPLT